MKAANGYRASNRYIAPSVPVKPTVYAGEAGTVRLRLMTDSRTAFNVEMTEAEAEALAVSIFKAIKIFV